MADIVEIYPDGEAGGQKPEKGAPPWFGFWFETEMDISGEDCNALIFIWGSFDDRGPFVINQEMFVDGSKSEQDRVNVLGMTFEKAQEKAREEYPDFHPANVICVINTDIAAMAANVPEFRGCTFDTPPDLIKLSEDIKESLLAFMDDEQIDCSLSGPVFDSLVPLPDLQASRAQIFRFMDKLHKLYHKSPFFDFETASNFLVEDPAFPPLHIFPLVENDCLDCLVCCDKGFDFEEMIEESMVDGEDEMSALSIIGQQLEQGGHFLMYISFLPWSGTPKEVTKEAREYFEDVYKGWVEEKCFPVLRWISSEKDAFILDPVVYARISSAVKAIDAFVAKRKKQNKWPAQLWDSLMVQVQEHGKRSVKVTIIPHHEG